MQNGKNILINEKTGRKKVVTYFDLQEEPSLVHPEFQSETDVNNIMRKYMTTGQINHLAGSSGVYGDFTEIGDYQEAMNTVIKAQESFETLPSKVRNRFANDPQELINFLKDPDNVEESIKLGLRTTQPLPQTEPIKTEPTT